MVIRVHNGTADSRTDTHVTFSTSLTDVDQVVVTIASVSYTHLDVYKRQLQSAYVNTNDGLSVAVLESSLRETSV